MLKKYFKTLIISFFTYKKLLIVKIFIKTPEVEISSIFFAQYKMELYE